MIEAQGLSKFYGDFAACRDITFSMDKGEIVAFLGPNGAGKSTTMKLLTGYLAPSEGVARIAGHDMSTDRLAGIGSAGIPAGEWSLVSRYDAGQPAGVLCRGPRIGDSKRTRDRIDAVVDICALASVFHKPISKLSKGFRQRVGMAQALLHEPDVLIMDEPTAGLDPNQIQEVRHTMQRLGEERTILLSTHILQEVEAMANRVIIVNEGRLVADAPLAEFTGDGKSLDREFQRLTTAAAS